jgi:hypothetical protein
LDPKRKPPREIRAVFFVTHQVNTGSISGFRAWPAAAFGKGGCPWARLAAAQAALEDEVAKPAKKK